MARRYVIDPEQAQQAALQPIASPVDTFAPPGLQAPVMQEIIDLAPLSKSFMGLASAVLEGEGEKVYKTGGTAFTENQPDILKAFSSGEKTAAEKLAALARSKAIPEHHIPQFYRGIYELAAEDQMRRYQDALKDKLDGYAQVEDKDGNFLPEPTKDADEVASDVWKQSFANSPIFQNFYAQQVASKFKGTIDSNWRSGAITARAQALKNWQIQKLAGKIGAQVDEASRTGDYTVVMETVQGLREYGVPDLQQTIAGSVVSYVGSLQARALNSQNPEEQAKLFETSKRILSSVDDMKFGGARLGDNSNISMLIDKAAVELEESESRINLKDQKDRTYALSQRAYRLIDDARAKNIPENEIKAHIKSTLLQYNYGAEASSVILKIVDDFISSVAVEAEGGVYDNLLITANTGKTEPNEWASALNLALTEKYITPPQLAFLNTVYNNARSSNSEQVRDLVQAASEGTSFDDYVTKAETEPVAKIAQNQKKALDNKLSKALVNASGLPEEERKSAEDKAIAEYQAGLSNIQNNLTQKVSNARARIRDLPADIPEDELADIANYLSRIEYEGMLQRRADYRQFTKVLASTKNADIADFDEQVDSANFYLMEENLADPMQAKRVHKSILNGKMIPAGERAFQEAMRSGLSTEKSISAALSAMREVVETTDNMAFRRAFGVETAVEKEDQQAEVDNKIRSAQYATNAVNSELNNSWFGPSGDKIQRALNSVQPEIGVSPDDVANNKKKFNELVVAGLWSTSKLSRQAERSPLVGFPKLRPPTEARDNTYKAFSKAWSGSALTSTQRKQLATSLAQAFGMTEAEALSGMIMSGDMKNAQITISSINPFSTPMFIDKYEALGSAGFELWINSDEAQDAITKMLSTYSKADPKDQMIRDTFILEQISSHRARYKNYVR